MGRISEVLKWKTCLKWQSKGGRRVHVNVHELRGRRKLAGRLARRLKNFHKRHLHMTDSRVSEAVTGKGRSGSRALNGVQRVGLPDVMGADVQIVTCVLGPAGIVGEKWLHPRIEFRRAQKGP